MPVPNPVFDQFTGFPATDINRILVAVLNRIFDAQSGQIATGQTFTPVGAHNSGLSISAAQTLTPPAGATKLRLQTLTQAVRYTLDGTTPTTSVGFQLAAAAAPIVIQVTPGTVVRVIQESATASLQYQWGA